MARKIKFQPHPQKPKIAITKVTRDFDKKLTVGMIVKNEEKSLRRCLEALRPLLDAVDGEVIVTDTGSTDSSVEIAEELADKVLHFTWCDDFAAARNTVWPHARGEWFMFIDADEIFDEDVHEIADFFNSGMSEKYNTATYCVRNYEQLEHLTYTDFYPMRLFRMRPGLAFQDIIHENIPWIGPLKRLNTVAHHDGYVDWARTGPVKRARNRVLLLKELEARPDDIRTLLHLTDTCESNAEGNREKIGYLTRALELIEVSAPADYTNMKEMWRSVLTCRLMRVYVENNEVESAHKLFETYWEKRGDETFGTQMDMQFMESVYWREKGNFSEMRASLVIYRELYEQYRDGAEWKDLPYSLLASGREQSYRDAKHDLIVCDILIGDEKEGVAAEAEALLDELDVPHTRDEHHVLKYLSTEFKFDRAFDRYDRIPAVYQALKDEDDAKALEDFQQQFAKQFGGIDEHKRVDYVEKAVRNLAEAEGDESFLLLNRLRVAVLDGEDAQAYALLDYLLADDSLAANPLYVDILYYALKLRYGVDFVRMQIDADTLGVCVRGINNVHQDMLPTVLAWMDSTEGYGADDLTALRWKTSLIAFALVMLTRPTNKKIENDKLNLQISEILIATYEDKEKAFRYLIEGLGRICALLYRPEVWKEDMLGQLPRLHQMTYHAQRAFEVWDQPTSCVHQLRLAAESYPLLKQTILEIAKQIQSRLQEQASVQSEFETLAAGVKAQIPSLIEAGLFEDAAQILQTYQAINPSDPDIADLLLLTQAGQGGGIVQ